jgi:hypothetical protein
MERNWSSSTAQKDKCGKELTKLAITFFEIKENILLIKMKR